MPAADLPALVATAQSSLAAFLPSPEARRIIARRERRWQAMSTAEQTTWFARRRQVWAATHTVADLVEWFAAPIVIGTSRDNGRQVIVALGACLRKARRLDTLVVDQRGNTTTHPVYLGQLRRYAPAFEICFYSEALNQLAQAYSA